MRVLRSILVLLLSYAATAAAWDYFEFDLPSQTRESAWRDALADKLGGAAEVPIEGGRIDVLTDDMAIEVDWPHKWHEGLGQALHYADVTARQGVVALIAYGQGIENLRDKTRRRFELVEEQCLKNGIQLVVLFPTQPRERSPVEPTHGAGDHWLNTSSGTRHNLHCRFYRNTHQGRACEEGEGHACSLCGG